jgi:hypothetical protein
MSLKGKIGDGDGDGTEQANYCKYQAPVISDSIKKTKERKNNHKFRS